MKTKRARLVGCKKFQIETVDFPPVNGSPIIEVKACGICGSDVHYWELMGDTLAKDFILGHEYTGVIVDPGRTDFKVGDRILGYTQNPYHDPCGVCPECLAGDFEHCSNREVDVALGCSLRHPGAYSRYLTWYPHAMFKLPDNVPLDLGALVEPYAIGLHAIELSNIRAGDKVLVLGGGLIACMISEWCRMYGASVISMTELNPQKAQLVRNLDVADEVYPADAPDLKERLRQAAPAGYDLVFDMLALSDPLNMALELLKRNGTCVMVGVNFKRKILVDVYDTVIYQKRIIGSKSHSPECFGAVVRAMQRGLINPAKYITRRIPLDEVQRAFEQITEKGLDFKVLIDRF